MTTGEASGEASGLRASNDRVDEHILSAGLRNLVAEEGWITTNSIV